MFINLNDREEVHKYVQQVTTTITPTVDEGDFQRWMSPTVKITRSIDAEDLTIHTLVAFKQDEGWRAFTFTD